MELSSASTASFPASHRRLGCQPEGYKLFFFCILPYHDCLLFGEHSSYSSTKQVYLLFDIVGLLSQYFGLKLSFFLYLSVL
jgi:hypothetical protein